VRMCSIMFNDVCLCVQLLRNSEHVDVPFDDVVEQVGGSEGLVHAVQLHAAALELLRCCQGVLDRGLSVYI
jgi:hypothetical protein